MTFRLALAMGEVDPDAMLARIGEATFQEWCAFYQLSPWGNEWRQTSRICASLFNSQPGRKTPVDEDGFMPARPPAVQQTPEEMRSALRMMLAGRKKKR